jgi:hypothetical protein
MPEEKEPRGAITARGALEFIKEMYEYIYRGEKPGWIDDVIGAGWTFDEIMPTGLINPEHKDISIVNMLKTADCTTLAAYALTPLRAGEVARLLSKSLYENFREGLRRGTEAIKNIPFVYNNYASLEEEYHSRRGGKSNNVFGENLIFKGGSEAEYTLSIKGKLKEGSGIVRKHEHNII